MKLEVDIDVYACYKSTSSRLKQPLPCKYGPAIRNLYVLTYVVSGKGYYEVNNKTYALSAGDSFLIYPGSKVKYYPDKDDKWEYIWVDFNGDKVQKMLEYTCVTPNNPVFYANENDIYEKFNVLSCFYEKENEKVRTVYRFKYMAYFYLLFDEYIKSYPTCNEKNISLKNKIINYIKEKYSEPSFSVTELEEYFCISKSVFYEYFKDNFHTTPKKYINDLRINSATILLHDKNVSVKDAALSVGFKDPLYFSKVFKEKNGINPSKYYEHYIKNEKILK